MSTLAPLNTYDLERAIDERRIELSKALLAKCRVEARTDAERLKLHDLANAVQRLILENYMDTHGLAVDVPDGDR